MRQRVSLQSLITLSVLSVGIFSGTVGLVYEFGAYQNALRELRRAVESWHKALVQRGADEGAGFDRMELLAWRTLGEGLLLIDMYEQGGQAHSEPPPRERRPQGLWARALNWWGRARR